MVREGETWEQVVTDALLLVVWVHHALVRHGRGEVRLSLAGHVQMMLP